MTFRLDLDQQQLTLSIRDQTVATFSDVTGTIYPVVWFWNKDTLATCDIISAQTVRGRVVRAGPSTQDLGPRVQLRWTPEQVDAGLSTKSSPSKRQVLQFIRDHAPKAWAAARPRLQWKLSALAKKMKSSEVARLYKELALELSQRSKHVRVARGCTAV